MPIYTRLVEFFDFLNRTTDHRIHRLELFQRHRMRFDDLQTDLTMHQTCFNVKNFQPRRPCTRTTSTVTAASHVLGWP